MAFDSDSDGDFQPDGFAPLLGNRVENRKSPRFLLHLAVFSCVYPLIGLCLGTCFAPFALILGVPWTYFQNTGYNFLLIYRKLTCYSGRVFESRLDLENPAHVKTAWKLAGLAFCVMSFSLPPLLSYWILPYTVSTRNSTFNFLCMIFCHIFVLIYLAGCYLKKRIEEKVELPFPTNVFNTSWIYLPSASDEFKQVEQVRKPLGEFDKFLDVICTNPSQSQRVPTLCCNIRRSPILAYLGLILEFMGLSALALKGSWDAGHTFNIVRSIFSWTIFDFGTSHNYLTTFFILAALPITFVIVISSLAACLGLSGSAAMNGAKKFLFDASEWFFFSGSLVFIGYYSSVLRMISCNFRIPNRQPFLDAYPDQECWVGTHQTAGLIALYNLILCLPILLGYILDPLTVGGMALDPDINHVPDFTRTIWTLPSFIIKDSIVKMAGIGIGIAFSSYPLAVIFGPMAAIVVLLLMVLYERPCFHWLFNVWRVAFLVASLWSCICSLVAYAVVNTKHQEWLPFNLLGGGWLLILLLTIVFLKRIKSDVNNPSYKIFPFFKTPFRQYSSIWKDPTNPLLTGQRSSDYSLGEPEEESWLFIDSPQVPVLGHGD